MQVSFRTPIGTRVSKTEETAMVVEGAVKKALGLTTDEKPGVVTTMIASSGLPQGRGGLFGGNSGPHAGNVNINLVPRTLREISDLKASEKVRATLGESLPGTQVFFSTGGIVKRILNFGSSAPIDVEILGYDVEEGQAYARLMLERLEKLSAADGSPLMTDLQISREENYPQLDVQVDRQKAGVLGISTQHDCPNGAGDPRRQHPVRAGAVHRPAHGQRVRHQRAREGRVPQQRRRPAHRPAAHARRGRMVSLETVASVKRSSGPVTMSRRYLQRIVDVTANVAPGKDLGTAADAVRAVLDELPPPDGFTVQLGGQAAAQKDAFAGLDAARR